MRVAEPRPTIVRSQDGTHCLHLDGELMRIPDSLWDTERRRTRSAQKQLGRLQVLLEQLPVGTPVHEGRVTFGVHLDLFNPQDNQKMMEVVQRAFPGWLNIKLEDAQRGAADQRRPHAHVVWVGNQDLTSPAIEDYWLGHPALDTAQGIKSGAGQRTLYGHLHYVAKPPLPVLRTRAWSRSTAHPVTPADFAYSIVRYNQAKALARKTGRRLPPISKTRRMSRQFLEYQRQSVQPAPSYVFDSAAHAPRHAFSSVTPAPAAAIQVTLPTAQFIPWGQPVNRTPSCPDKTVQHGILCHSDHQRSGASADRDRPSAPQEMPSLLRGVSRLVPCAERGVGVGALKNRPHPPWPLRGPSKCGALFRTHLPRRLAMDALAPLYLTKKLCGSLTAPILPVLLIFDKKEGLRIPVLQVISPQFTSSTNSLGLGRRLQGIPYPSSLQTGD